MQGLYPQALHFVERGLVQHPEDSLLMQLKSDAEAKAEMQALRVAANRERHQQQEVAVQTMLDVRGITLEPDSPYSREISKPKVFDGGLQWSLFFVIDRVSTVEVVHDVSEQWFLDAQLELLFAQPTSWNPNGEYSLDNSVCYYEGDNLTPINTHAPLGMVLEVVQKVKGVPTFRVVLVCDDKEFQTNQKIERCL
ncbi:MAG: uncharacterized protein KVP18_003477 [Porospora cf. gigantea A]|nr:MAG: hypothetical protein KVP18_003477 [Porospora cf. gigantea A]